jgi:DNA modification methylase
VNKTITTRLIEAAQNRERVSGLTHNFYRYPARFSPHFAHAAIEAFTKVGDAVLDPYMGGGTAIVEAIAAGRRAYGNDLNSLAVFVARVKTTFLDSREAEEIQDWVEKATRLMSFRTARSRLRPLIDDPKAGNLTLPVARSVKKAIAAALLEVPSIQNERVRDFARCVVLRTAQWALDGRDRGPSLEEVRLRIRVFAAEMLHGLEELKRKCCVHRLDEPKCTLVESDAAILDTVAPFSTGRVKADLIVTSPPYPGVHVLYHRWQVNGRRETPAPYWIANCNDGQGASFYNFGDLRGRGLTKYFKASLDNLLTARRLIRDGGKIVQLVAFSDPESQLSMYLENMRAAGFEEMDLPGNCHQRIWRDVPSRKWHASLKGRTSSSREVVLIHQAV